MSAQSDVDRHRKAVQVLHERIGKESAKVGNARQKALKAREGAQRSNSPGTQSSKLREAERDEANATKAEQQRAKLEKELAAKTKSLHQAETRLSKEQATEQTRRMKRVQDSIDRSASQFRPSRPEAPIRSATNATTGGNVEEPPEYDVFISHASEDKEEIARPLATALRDAGLRVWFDEFTLQVGDSLRRKIDEGLANSTFGVVILSPNFFAKEWPQTELDGLSAKATATGESVILPIWHHISKQEVLDRSPTLGGLMALNTALMTLEEIVAALVQRVRPE